MTATSSIRQVVLIDDNSADNLYHRLVLEEWMPLLHVTSTSSGAEALEYMADSEEVDQTGYDLLLLDLNMPAMTGWEFLDAFDAQSLSLPSRVILVVLSTTENPDEMARAADDPRVDGFLSKPLVSHRLVTVIGDHKSDTPGQAS